MGLPLDVLRKINNGGILSGYLLGPMLLYNTSQNVNIVKKGNSGIQKVQNRTVLIFINTAFIDLRAAQILRQACL
jgi:hypothetical protein